MTTDAIPESLLLAMTFPHLNEALDPRPVQIIYPGEVKFRRDLNNFVVFDHAALVQALATLHTEDLLPIRHLPGDMLRYHCWMHADVYFGDFLPDRMVHTVIREEGDYLRFPHYKGRLFDVEVFAPDDERLVVPDLFGAGQPGYRTLLVGRDWMGLAVVEVVHAGTRRAHRQWVSVQHPWPERGRGGSGESGWPGPAGSGPRVATPRGTCEGMSGEQGVSDALPT